MVKWFSKSDAVDLTASNNVVDGIKKLYRKYIRSIEETHFFQDFYSAPLQDSDFEAKPMVMLCGQYSVGKTSFIQYLLDREFPGSRIGPEPTTDRFTAIMHGNEDRIIPGNALAMEQDKPFTALTRFGTSFLSKFEASICDCSVLENFTLIDTPGVLAGEKQRIGRAYDFPKVVEWFAERSDLIILIFDAHKLDISDEFKRTIETLKGHDDKIRVVLNKADMVSNQQLMRVYGALMWSLGKVFLTPEVVKVYIGSFWEKPYQNQENKALFDAEREDLFKDLRGLGKNSAVRKVNELVKRTRYVKVHVLIVTSLRSEMPLFGKAAKQEKLIESLEEVFEKIRVKHRLPLGDFPSVRKYRELLKSTDFMKFPKEDPSRLKKMEEVLQKNIPDLVAKFPLENELSTGDELNPFEKDVQFDEWIVPRDKIEAATAEFQELGPSEDSKLTGAQCKPTMQSSGLPVSQLSKLWTLSDVDEDGKLDLEEFILMKYLVDICLAGDQLPDKLERSWFPPSKRDSTIYKQRMHAI